MQTLPPFESSAPAAGRRAIAAVIVVLLVEACALLNALPRMQDAIWQDEAATLLNFAVGGWAKVVFDYDSPNNHILFSAMLAGWLGVWRDGVDVFVLRLLPLLFYLAAVPVVMLAARRMGGRACAVLAGLLFAFSAVAANFATQLRGYSPSMFFVALVLLCALNAAGARRRAWRIGYVLACVGSVALLPSNLVLALVLGIACSIRLLVERGWRGEQVPATLAVLLVGPFCGLLAYLPVFDALWSHSQVAFSEWQRGDLMLAWLQGALFDFRYLLPGFAAGLAIGALEALRAWRQGKREALAPFALVVALFCGLAGAILVMPNTPFPRTLVPYLGIWCCALSWCLERALLAVATRKRLALGGVVAVATLLLMLAARPLPSCRGATSARSVLEYDLCYQYFRDQYRPELVIATWIQLDRPDVPIVTDFEGFYSLKVLSVPALGVYEFRHFPRHWRGPAPLVVVHRRDQVGPMLDQIGAGSTAYRLVVDTGYFEVYATDDYGAAFLP